MTTLFHIYRSSTRFSSFSKPKIHPRGFTLIEEQSLAPTLQRFHFKKDHQLIQVFLYSSSIQEELYMLIEECELTNRFMEDLRTKDYHDANVDVFLVDTNPAKIIEAIEQAVDLPEEAGKLHIYGQQMWHSDAFIVGNREALERLRNAIDQALQYGEKRELFYPEDNEAFDLYISCTEDSFAMSQLDPPYHDPEIFSKRKNPVQAFRYYPLTNEK
ncbi:hypothetical protein [Sporosarcina sp. Marseille-Q4943]|uniref:hypothetical protein n=1 Tax=Sporosarcina sp. Marseille-Q4943 TaxID=2942204 RepID=UPI00208DC9F1|nr:hypothetical protein [Sporosarcina sp. Marseille-Q4943]